MDQEVLLEIKGRIGILTLNRPEKLNALRIPSMFPEALEDAVDRATRDREIRVLVITGAGRGFCSGADVNDLQDLYGQAPETIMDLNRRFDGIMYRLITLGKPTIAAVNGPAVGAGACLALACDLILASPEARFGWIFIHRGISPAEMGAGYLLPRRVGLGRTWELLYTGKTVGADEAATIGLVNQVAPAVLDAALSLAEEIANGPERALAMCKSAVLKGLNMDLASEMELELAGETFTMLSEHHQAGIRAFLDRNE